MRAATVWALALLSSAAPGTAQAERLSCTVRIHPRGAVDKAVLSVRNGCSFAVDVVWIDDQGETHRYKKLAPRGIYRRYSDEARPWMIAAGKSRCLARRIAAETSETATACG